MKIIVGLGNPGWKYKNTRHNAGFLAIGSIAKKYRLKLDKKGFEGIYAVGDLNGKRIMLFEPMTYMNLSGAAVEKVCSSKLEHSRDLLVISDDFNLAFGRLRLRQNGSGGGHNGLESIIESIGSDFARLRIGIGKEDGGTLLDVSRYVLTPFSYKEKSMLKAVLLEAVSCIEIWIMHGIQTAMNRYNVKREVS